MTLLSDDTMTTTATAGFAAVINAAKKAAKPKDTNQLTTMNGTPPTSNLFRAGHKYDIAPVSEFDFEPIGNNLNVFA